MATCTLITLDIRNELSYDRNYPDADLIYRVVGDFQRDGDVNSGTDWPAPFSPVLTEEFPEIEKSARIMPHFLIYGAGSKEIRPADRAYNTIEDGFAFADQSLLDILQ